MKIALTFDDGNGPITNDLLAVLRQYKAKATFFCVSSRINNETIKSMQNDGHIIAGHHYDHVPSTELTLDEFCEQVTKTNDLLKAVTQNNLSYYRPPYGLITDEQEQWLIQQGMTPVYWTINSHDYDDTLNSAEFIAGQILSNAHDNGVILCHDNGKTSRKNTLKAIKFIIPFLIECGYEFVTVDDLDPQQVNNNKIAIKTIEKEGRSRGILAS